MYRTDVVAANDWQSQLQYWGPKILGAIAILLVAYIVALIVKWAISKVVDRVPALKRHNEAEPGKTLGSLIGDIAFWLIILFGIMFALQPLGMTRVLEPVNRLTTNVFAFIPNLIGAGLIFAIGLVVAKIVRRIVEEALIAARADDWLSRAGLTEGRPATAAAGAVSGSTQTPTPAPAVSFTDPSVRAAPTPTPAPARPQEPMTFGGPPASGSSMSGPATQEPLVFGGPPAPGASTAASPTAISTAAGAGTTTQAPPPPAPPAPSPAPASPPPAPAAAATRRRGASLSRSVGTLVFYLIMIPVTIMALDTLQIQAISGPATAMLNTILNAIPNIVAALVLLAIGYILGKLAKQFIEQLLPSAGFDRAVGALGFTSETNTPSRTVGTIVMIAILLFFAIKAAELLQSPIIAVMLAQVLELGSRILFGTAIILGGVVIARIVANLVSGAGTEGWLPAILKWSIIALSVAMGLTFMGLANEIVIIAFASIIGSAAVACALAFGLGGRPTAHKLLEQWTSGNGIPRPPGTPRAPTPPAPGSPPPL
jgi:hypothetical protein